MIKHHPNTELLSLYVVGDLPASLSAAISIHNDLCPQCAEEIKNLTEESASFNFEQDVAIKTDVTSTMNAEKLNDVDMFDIDALIANITADDSIDVITEQPKKSITIKGAQYTIPRAIQSVELGKWSSIGKLTRARLSLDEGHSHSSLLHIAPNGSVPEHTHKGTELTLLLDGTFEDEMGSYVPGDFILLDGQHKHNPVTKQGCLCYTVVDDALIFTQGLNRLLNPIGSLIY